MGLVAEFAKKRNYFGFASFKAQKEIFGKMPGDSTSMERTFLS